MQSAFNTTEPWCRSSQALEDIDVRPAINIQPDGALNNLLQKNKIIGSLKELCIDTFIGI
jgi:hypothetical protein